MVEAFEWLEKAPPGTTRIGFFWVGVTGEKMVGHVDVKAGATQEELRTVALDIVSTIRVSDRRAKSLADGTPYHQTKLPGEE